MNYKSILHITLLLISSPARAWEEIRLQTDRQSVFGAFVYPMIGLCGLSTFIGALITTGWSTPESFQSAMTQCCGVAVSLFGGYYLAAYLLQRLMPRLGLQPPELLEIQFFTGYSLVAIFCLRFAVGFLPDFQLIGLLLQFYTVFIVWEGAPLLLPLDEKRRLPFTLTCSLLLIATPMVIQLVFNQLTTRLVLL
ncbi:MAG: YIP1 family protein [Prevotellaceae bacterium]|nr:YIP1 family protein [Prevotellaceae bacterium]